MEKKRIPKDLSRSKIAVWYKILSGVIFPKSVGVETLKPNFGVKFYNRWSNLEKLLALLTAYSIVQEWYFWF